LRLYPKGSTLSLSPFSSFASSLEQPLPTVVASLGSLWYLTVTSAGLALVALVALVATSARSDQLERRIAAGFVNVAGALAVSTVFVAPSLVGASPTRVDLPFYGRYVEQWLPVLILLGLAALHRSSVRPRIPLMAATMILAAEALVVQRFDSELWGRPFAATNISGLYFIRSLMGSFDLPRAAPILAIALLGLLWLSTRLRSRWGLAVTASAVATFSAVTMTTCWLGPASLNKQLGNRHIAEVDAAYGRTVAFDIRQGDRNFGLYNSQFWRPDLDFILVEGPMEYGDATYVLSTLDDPNPPSVGGRLMGTGYRTDRVALGVVDPRAREELEMREVLFPEGFERDQELPRSATMAGVEIISGLREGEVQFGTSIRVEVVHQGTGSPWSTAWPFQPVRLGGRIRDADSGDVVAEVRSWIVPLLAPGDRTVVDLLLPPATAFDPDRSYRLDLGVVEDGVQWFAGSSAEIIEATFATAGGSG
jgi:hypothetical protein